MVQKKLVSKILAASNHIAKESSLGYANHIIVSSRVAKSFSMIHISINRMAKIKRIYGIY